MIFCTGSNGFGQLGTVFPTNIPVPFECNSVKGDSSSEKNEINDIQCCSLATVILYKDGSISQSGYLNGTVSPHFTPIQIQLPLKCIQIACGRKHCMALLGDGSTSVVMSWGTGYFGQLGHGDDVSWDTPRMIKALDTRNVGSRVKKIACGGAHSGALLENNSVFMWGLNKGGQCGTGAAKKRDNVPEPRPVILPDCGDVHELVLGRSHSALLTCQGRVFVWGESTYGRLGVPDSSSSSNKKYYHPVEIPLFATYPAICLTTGDFHMMAICVISEIDVNLSKNNALNCSNKAVYSWGYGGDGQTGHSVLFNVKTPRRIEAFDDIDIVSVKCGACWSTATSRNGDLYTWGYGDGGWLGLKRPNAQSMPVYDSDKMDVGERIIEQHAHIRSFDSRHTVVRPQRVKYLTECGYAADINFPGGPVRTGSAHMIIFCTPLVNTSKATTPQRDGLAYNSAGDTTSNEEDDQIDHNKAGSKGSFYNKSSNEVNSAVDAKKTHRNTIYDDVDRGSEYTADSKPYSSPFSPRKLSADAAAISSQNSLKAISRLLHHCRSGNIEELERMLSQAAKISPRQLMTHNNDSNTFADCQDSLGNTPLIAACQSGQRFVCELLVSKYQVNVNLCNLMGNSPLHYCFNFGHDSIGQMLIKHGANEYLTNRHGLTCYEGLTHSDLENI